MADCRRITLDSARKPAANKFTISSASRAVPSSPGDRKRATASAETARIECRRETEICGQSHRVGAAARIRVAAWLPVERVVGAGSLTEVTGRG